MANLIGLFLVDNTSLKQKNRLPTEAVFYKIVNLSGGAGHRAYVFLHACVDAIG